MAKFPKMDGGSFPHIDTVNVNQWINEFDYSRYDHTQMKLTICAVPWDMGEAHIGNRTISGIGNVVWFETKEKRDAWFAAIPDSECIRIESKYKELHRDLFIDVPIPFDVAAKYNYLVVEYSMFANDDSPVMYENADGVRKWFWFIREVEYLAPNTTRLHILDDAFQTWMYDVHLSGMILERGHAPMFATKTDTYLADPIDNATNLLTEDVNYGEADIARAASEFVFNAGIMYALVITTSAPGGTWGTKAGGDWRTPGNWNIQIQGVPSYYAFALPASNLSTFLSGINSSYPQFVQTLKAIAFVSEDLLTFGGSFTFASVTCYNVSANYTQNELMNLTKSMFGYPSQYADVAKLYTAPYAHIEVSDENGNVTVIKVEDTNGTLNVESNVSLAFPWLTINAHLSGIGKTARRNVTFANVTSRNMPIQGNWYQALQSWNIPTFGVYQDAGTNNDYATHFDRAQQALAANNEYTSATASAATAQTNTNANADTVLDNADLNIAYNDAIYSADNTYHVNITAADTGMNSQQAAAANAYIGVGVNDQIQAADEQAAIAAASAAATGATSVITNLVTGNIPGAINAAVGSGASVASTIASNNVAVNLTTSQAGNAQAANNSNAAQSNANMNSKNTAYATQAGAANMATDDLTEGAAANNAATMIDNAARDYATDTANAGRRLATAQAAITNQIAQAALNAPAEFGAWSYGDLATSRPMGLFANVVTQSDAAISAAGDEMLRYGYTFGKQWAFDGNWNIGKYFTYWKLKDFWVTNLNVPDMYMDKLRFFLFGGVTVWRKPEDIGKRTIYENYN